MTVTPKRLAQATVPNGKNSFVKLGSRISCPYLFRSWIQKQQGNIPSDFLPKEDDRIRPYTVPWTWWNNKWNVFWNMFWLINRSFMFNFRNVKILIILIMSFSNTARADLDFFSRILLSNKKYEKYITVRSAVVIEDELMNYFRFRSG